MERKDSQVVDIESGTEAAFTFGVFKEKDDDEEVTAGMTITLGEDKKIEELLPEEESSLSAEFQRKGVTASTSLARKTSIKKTQQTQKTASFRSEESVTTTELQARAGTSGAQVITALTTEAKAEKGMKIGRPPVIITPLRDMTLKVGEKLSITTTVSGEPAPSVEWYKDGARLIKSRYEKSQSPEESTATLTIRQSTPEDTGAYMIRAENNIAVVEQSFQIVVEEREDVEASAQFGSFTLAEEEAEDEAVAAMFTLPAEQPEATGDVEAAMTFRLPTEEVDEPEDLGASATLMLAAEESKKVTEVKREVKKKTEEVSISKTQVVSKVTHAKETVETVEASGVFSLAVKKTEETEDIEASGTFMLPAEQPEESEDVEASGVFMLAAAKPTVQETKDEAASATLVLAAEEEKKRVVVEEKKTSTTKKVEERKVVEKKIIEQKKVEVVEDIEASGVFSQFTTSTEEESADVEASGFFMLPAEKPAEEEAEDLAASATLMVAAKEQKRIVEQKKKAVVEEKKVTEKKVTQKKEEQKVEVVEDVQASGVFVLAGKKTVEEAEDIEASGTFMLPAEEPEEGGDVEGAFTFQLAAMKKVDLPAEDAGAAMTFTLPAGFKTALATTYSVTEKQEIRLTVEVAEAKTEVEWSVAGKKIDKSTMKYKIESVGTTRTLLVRSASVTDSGKYEVKLIKSGEASKTELKVDKFGPISKPEDQKPIEGEQVELAVEFNKEPTDVTWVKEGSEPRDRKRITTEVVGKKVFLKIKDAEEMDSGIYLITVDGVEVATSVQVQSECAFSVFVCYVLFCLFYVHLCYVF